MKKFIHALCLTALLCTSLSVQAQNACLTKAEAQAITFSWMVSGKTYTSNLAETAKEPYHIRALLREVYINENVPGPYYSAYKSDGVTREDPVYYGPIGKNPAKNDWRITDGVAKKPLREGYTMLLVALKDDFTDQTAVSTEDMNYTQLINYITQRIDSVYVITDGLRMSEGSNPGTLFSVKGKLNRFFFLSKGKARKAVQSSVSHGAQPFYRMFEEFSPYIEGDKHDNVTDFYNRMITGESMPIEHDCNSIFGLNHYFSMSGRTGKTAYDMTGLNLFIPDHRLQYWTEPYEDYFYYKKQNTDNAQRYYITIEGLDRRSAYYANIGVYQNEAAARAKGPTSTATFTNYNPDHAVYTFLYAIKLRAERSAQPTEVDGKNMYTVNLNWSSTFSEATSTTMPQDYELYRVVNGVREAEPIETFTDVLTWSEQVEQKEQGYMLSYVVLGKIKGDQKPPIPSNIASVAIPGDNPEERLALDISGKHESTYVPNEQINKYANYVVLNNAVGNSITKGMLQEGTQLKLHRIDQGAEVADAVVATLTITAVNASNCEWTLTYDHQDHADEAKYGPTSGTFAFASNDDVQFNNLELCDQFSASTLLNDHQSDYKYQMTIENLVDGAFKDKNDNPCNHAHSNEADVYVYKTEHQLLNASFTKAQVDADITNNGTLAKLNPGVTMEFATINDRNVLNYYMYRDGSEISSPNKVYGQRQPDGTTIAHNNDGNDIIWPANANAQLTDLPAIGSYTYVPVIETYRDDNSGARNTYGTDQKRASVARVTVQDTKVASSTYTFTDEGLNCRTYATGLKIKADVPDGMELKFIRVWHQLPEGYAHENKDEANRGRLNQTQRCYLYDIDSFVDGAPAEVGTSLGQDCKIDANKEVWVWDHFGALDIMENSSVDPFNVQYVVRLYCTVNRPAGGPRRAEGNAANWVIVEDKAEAEFTSTNVVTSVAGVEVAPQVTGVRYINLAGQSSSRPWPGINLVVKTLNNGTTSTSKAVF